MYDTCHVLFLCEAIVNIPAPLPPTGSEPPTFESAIPLCVEVTSQNSLHCTDAIEGLDTDTAPGLSIQLSGSYTEVTWSQKGGEEPGEEERGMGDIWRQMDRGK